MHRFCCVGKWFVSFTILAFFASNAPAGPISELYLVSKSEKGGGKSAFNVVQGSSIVGSWSAQHGNELAIAVNSTVRTMGVLNLPAPGDLGAEYSLSGVPTGIDFPMPIASPPTVQFLDGTTDGVHNYAWDFNNNAAYQFDLNWSNPIVLFTLTGVSRAGITYDPSNNSLWLSQFGGTLVEDHSMTGDLLSSFSVGHIQNAALALDPADGTLWLGSQAQFGVFEQYSRSGAFLSSETYSALTTVDVLGAEFQTVPEPSACGILLLGTVIFLRPTRRRHQS